MIIILGSDILEREREQQLFYVYARTWMHTHVYLSGLQIKRDVCKSNHLHEHAATVTIAVNVGSQMYV